MQRCSFFKEWWMFRCWVDYWRAEGAIIITIYLSTLSSFSDRGWLISLKHIWYIWCSTEFSFAIYGYIAQLYLKYWKILKVVYRSIVLWCIIPIGMMYIHVFPSVHDNIYTHLSTCMYIYIYIQVLTKLGLPISMPHSNRLILLAELTRFWDRV